MSDTPVTSKRCARCKIEKPRGDFYRAALAVRKKSPHALRSYCKRCHIEYTAVYVKRWAERNPEKVKAAQRRAFHRRYKHDPIFRQKYLDRLSSRRTDKEHAPIDNSPLPPRGEDETERCFFRRVSDHFYMLPEPPLTQAQRNFLEDIRTKELIERAKTSPGWPDGTLEAYIHSKTVECLWDLRREGLLSVAFFLFLVRILL